MPVVELMISPLEKGGTHPTTAIAVDREPDSSRMPKLSASQENCGVEQPKRDNKVLLSNIVWMLVGNVLYGLSQWSQLVALSKVGSIEMVGVFAMALAVCLPVLMFSSLSLRSMQVTDYRRSHHSLEYMAIRILTLSVALIIIVLFGVVAGHPRTVVFSTGLIAAAKAVEYISDILYGVLQRQEHMSGIAISMSLRAVVSVAALSLGVYVTHSLLWGAACMLGSSMLVLAGYDIPKTLAVEKMRFGVLIGECRLFWSQLAPSRGGRERLWKLGKAGLPLGFVLMMVSLNLNIPRYFIQHYLGIQELAIFSAIATLLAAGSAVTNAMGQAAAPRMAKCFVLRDSRGFNMLLAGLVTVSLGLGCLGFLGALFFGRQGMTLIYRPEYSTHPDVLIWLMGASGFFYLGSTLGYAVTAIRCFRPQMPLFTGAALSTAIGCLVLMPSQGLRGAAMAIFVSALVQCGGSTYLLRKALRMAYMDPGGALP